MKPTEVDWKEVYKRLDSEKSKSYGRLMLKPKPDCDDCHGTGISSHSYDCGAYNCTGHNDIICSCRELRGLECPFMEDHANVHGNWHVVYDESFIFVQCYNMKAHTGKETFGYVRFKVA